VIGHAATPKAARRIVLRASSKGLHATMERDGCSKRLEVEIGVRTKAQAEATMKQAQSDGFKSVTIERS